MMDAARERLVEFGRRLITHRLTTGSGGNLSVFDRAAGSLAVTPSGMDYFAIGTDDIVVCDLEGRLLSGRRKPSSELPIHLQLYARRPDVGAVVHTHSVFATTLACLHREIPAVHYLVGFAGGHKVPLAPYAPFGSAELAEGAAAALGSGQAVLLANHGLVAVGRDLPSAFNVAEEIEFVAQVYCRALAVGEPKILSREQMEDVLIRFRGYGQQPDA